MSQLIATINGKKVYSDKPVSSIINTRVNFTDGSWCDVATGEVVNQGRGSINIGAPNEGPADKCAWGPKKFDAISLDVRSLSGAVLDIQPHDQPYIAVAIEGLQPTVDNISVFAELDSVVIESQSKMSNDNKGMTIITGNGSQVIRGGSISGSSVMIGGSNISIGGGRITVNGISIGGGGSSETDTRVSVKVPYGASVSVSGTDNKVVIGDTKGNVSLSNGSVGDFFVGNVKDLIVDIFGSSDVNVNSASGDVLVNIKGTGDVRIRNGQVNNLNVSIMGTGDFSFIGKTKHANLKVMGTGDIFVAHSDNRPTSRVLGTGDIKVGNW